MESKERSNGGEGQGGGPVSGKLRSVMETRAGFMTRWGITVVFLLFGILFALAWLIPLDRFGSRSFIDYLIH